MIKKYIALLLIISISIFSLTGCSEYKSIDEFSYVIALGIDFGTNNTLKISFQISTTSSSSSGDSSEGSSDSIVDTIECSSIDSGISLMNVSLTKQIDLSTCKAIVISEEVAYAGVSTYISTLMNKVEIRPDCNLIITRSTAEDFLKTAQGSAETGTADYYHSSFTSSENIGYSEQITLSDFYFRLKDTFGEPYTILGAVNSVRNTRNRC